MVGSPSLQWEGKTKTTIRSEAEELIICASFVAVVGDFTYSLLLCVIYAPCQCLVHFFYLIAVLVITYLLSGRVMLSKVIYL